jgi:hypothetical protein
MVIMIAVNELRAPEVNADFSWNIFESRARGALGE